MDKNGSFTLDGIHGRGLWGQLSPESSWLPKKYNIRTILFFWTFFWTLDFYYQLECSKRAENIINRKFRQFYLLDISVFFFLGLNLKIFKNL